jgi:hypothetical protein
MMMTVSKKMLHIPWPAQHLEGGGVGKGVQGQQESSWPPLLLPCCYCLLLDSFLIEGAAHSFVEGILCAHF